MKHTSCSITKHYSEITFTAMKIDVEYEMMESQCVYIEHTLEISSLQWLY